MEAEKLKNAEEHISNLRQQVEFSKTLMKQQEWFISAITGYRYGNDQSGMNVLGSMQIPPIPPIPPVPHMNELAMPPTQLAIQQGPSGLPHASQSHGSAQQQYYSNHGGQQLCYSDPMMGSMSQPFVPGQYDQNRQMVYDEPATGAQQLLNHTSVNPRIIEPKREELDAASPAPEPEVASEAPELPRTSTPIENHTEKTPEPVKKKKSSSNIGQKRRCDLETLFSADDDDDDVRAPLSIRRTDSSTSTSISTNLDDTLLSIDARVLKKGTRSGNLQCPLCDARFRSQRLFAGHADVCCGKTSKKRKNRRSSKN